MKIRKGLTPQYEELKYANLSVADVNTREYHAYIFDKAEEFAEQMEEIISNKGTITSNEINDIFDKLDTGMSSFQYTAIFRILSTYWVYSEYIKTYNTEMMDYDN